MISAKLLFMGILIFGAFSSLLLTIVVDVIYLASTPSVHNINRLAIDTGNLILQSQAVVKDSVIKLGIEGTLDDSNYSSFLFQRTISGSLLTILFVFVVFKVLNKLPALNLTADLYLVILAILIIGLVQVFTSLVITGGLIYPYAGFLEIIDNPDTIVNYIEHTANTNRLYVNETEI